MSEFGLIKDHPDSKEIMSKLLSGSEPKDVAQWLKLKYSKKNQSHLRLTQKLLKEFAYECSRPVTEIRNASIIQCKVPTQWKEANVIPIPKQNAPCPGQAASNIFYLLSS